jgi:hypothetical protein
MNSSIRWSDQTLPMPVYLAVDLLAELEGSVREALQALPRTGLGVGGLLTGTREPGWIRVEGRVEIPCSYAMGPSFVLIPEELEGARGLARTAAGRAGNAVVGWYRSKTNGPLTITEHDRTLFDELCPEPWQLALLIKPIKAAPTTAVFAFRDSGETPTGGFRLGEPVEMPLPQPMGDDKAMKPDAPVSPEVVASNPVPEPCERIPLSAAQGISPTVVEGAPPSAEGALRTDVEGAPRTDVEGTTPSAAQGAPPTASHRAQPPDAEVSGAQSEAASPPLNPDPVRVSMPYTGTLFGLPETGQKGNGGENEKPGLRPLKVALIVLAMLGVAVLIAGYFTGWFGILPP